MILAAWSSCGVRSARAHAWRSRVTRNAGEMTALPFDGPLARLLSELIPSVVRLRGVQNIVFDPQFHPYSGPSEGAHWRVCDVGTNSFLREVAYY
jgi:hypothetical protein